MSTAAEQLASLNEVIAAIEAALKDDTIVRYRLPSGHEVQRVNFGTTLATLYAERRELTKQAAVAGRRRVVRGGMRGVG